LFYFRARTQNNVITLEPQLDPRVSGLYHLILSAIANALLPESQLSFATARKTEFDAY
jgi:hypothetical protein